jgi:hypothetical protein
MVINNWHIYCFIFELNFEHFMKFLSVILIIFGYLQAQQTRINMGPNINDPKATDCYPNISPDGKTLYFSRQLNGNYDIP